MQNERLEEMIGKITSGEYTREELSVFLKDMEELDEPSYIKVYNEIYKEVSKLTPVEMDPSFKAAIEARLDRAEEHEVPVVMMRRRWIMPAVAAAIVIFLVVGGGIWLYSRSRIRVQPLAAPAVVRDVAPGRNKATLTLGNGATVFLDSAANGLLAQQGASRVEKLNNGQLAYKKSDEKPGGETEVYNTLSTPRGGQYQLTLPDGTSVWLNAASSLRYPVAFTGRERTVELNGEGYFEVAANVRKPFVVTSRGIKVNVLGTHFDIRNYPEETAIRTSLLEGKVAVSAGREERVLKPGEQVSVSLTARAGDMTVSKADEAEVLAWLRGKLSTGEVDVKTLMYNISRWYDVDVRFEGRAPDRRFWALISRNVYLSDVMRVLEANGIHVRLEEKTLVVAEK